MKVTNHNTKIVAVLLCLATSGVNASERDKAKRLFSSLTGNTANKVTANRYENMIKNGQAEQAAKEIVEGNFGFYNVTLKNFFTPISNEDGTTMAPLNDTTATLIGVTRDDLNFFSVFYENILYQFDGTLITSDASSVPLVLRNRHKNNDHLYLADYNVAVHIYNRTKNDQYVEAEKYGVPLGDKKYLIRTQQNTYTTKDQAAISGIFSTRGWAAAYYEGGTNRAAFAFFAKHFLCKEMEQLNDTSTPDFRVRRDVDRAPGGSSKTYKNFCVGCHAGQDALGGAFSYYNFVGTSQDGAMHYAAHEDVDENGTKIEVGPVAPKINRNNLFPDGKIVQSDSWLNLWATGQNEYLGWGPQKSGNGVFTLGKMFAETKQVRTCLSERVFETVCFKKPVSDGDKEIVRQLADNFDKDANMKNLFIGAAVACMGE